MFAAAGEDAAQRADVAVVATVGDGDVVHGGQEIVCRVEVHPAELGTVHREPGVRSVRARQPFLAFQRAGAQVAAHVARGQAERAQARDGEMREVLADAAAFLHDDLQRRRDGGGDGVVFEVVEYAAVQVQRAYEEGCVFRKARAPVVAQLRRGRQ